MNVPKEPGRIRAMIQSRVRQVVAKGPVLGASLVLIAKRCGREGCRCETGEKHTGNYITFRLAGKTKTVYVPLDLVDEVRSWIKEHKRLKQLTHEISDLTVALIRGHAAEARRQKGQSPQSESPPS